MSEEHKAKLRAGREAKKLARLSEKSNEANFVTKNEFIDFKNEIVDILKENLTKEKKEVVEEDGGEQGIVKNQTNLPSAYQGIFEEYFDVEDGFEAEISYEGNISFTIIVPERFSNTTEAWKSYYKVDRRTKVLKQGNIEGGIRDWCILVARNLKYNKNLQTK